MKKVLVIGATGNMGTPLCPLLVNAGYEVHAIAGEIGKNTTPGVTYHLANAMDHDVLQGFLDRKFDAIVDFMVYRAPGFFAERLPRMLGATGQYVLFSSYRVYADSREILTETSPRLSDALAPDDPWRSRAGYAQAKCAMEDMLHASPLQNWTALRPVNVYSPKRIPLVTWTKTEVAERAYAGKKLLLPREAMPVRANIICCEDAAKMIAGVVLNEKAFGEIYNVASSENPTWNEILDFYHDEIGLEAELCDAKDFPQIVYGDSLASKLDWWNNIFWYSRVYDLDVDNTKILQATGLRREDLTPVREGLARMLKGAIPKTYRNMDAFLAGK